MRRKKVFTLVDTYNLTKFLLHLFTLCRSTVSHELWVSINLINITSDRGGKILW